MKKALKLIVATLIIMAALTAGGIYYLSSQTNPSDEFKEKISLDQSDEGELSNKAYRYEMEKTAIDLNTSGEKKNVFVFDSNRPYDVNTSKTAKARIARLVKRTKAPFEKPIIALNPFGTNENTFYFHFETKKNATIKYTITVQDEAIPDYVRYVKNGGEGNLTDSHDFVVSGLVPGKVNYIIMESLDRNGTQIDQIIYRYTMPMSANRWKIDVLKDRSRDKLTSGLYFVMPNADPKIYVYDNNGFLRNTVVTEGYHGRRIYQSDTYIIYQISRTKVAKVSPTGEVIAVCEVKGFGDIKDFSYDGYANVYSVVSKKGVDYLVSTSFETGNTSIIKEFPKNITLASIVNPEAGSIYIATKKPAGIIKLDAITSKSPKVAAVIGKKSAWKKTKFAKKVIKDNAVNNWDTTNSFLNRKIEGGLERTDTLSSYIVNNKKGTAYEFSFDAKNKKIKITENLPVGLSGVCGCQSYEGHYIISQCSVGSYAEYDGTGEVVKRFSYDKPIDAVTKLSLVGMCFV